MSPGRLFLDRVGRNQSPSPLRWHPQTTTHFPRGYLKPELSTLLGSGTFYFAATGRSGRSERLTPGSAFDITRGHRDQERTGEQDRHRGGSHARPGGARAGGLHRGNSGRLATGRPRDHLGFRDLRRAGTQIAARAQSQKRGGHAGCRAACAAISCGDGPAIGHRSAHRSQLAAGTRSRWSMTRISMGIFFSFSSSPNCVWRASKRLGAEAPAPSAGGGEKAPPGPM